MEIIENHRNQSPRYLREALVPACVLGGIIAVDHFFVPGATVTPVCNFVAMGILALYLPPRVMIFWAVCFTTSSLFMLNWPSLAHFEMPGRVLITESRSVGAIAGGTLAVLLCVSRWRADRGHAQLAALVRRLPVPFVLSDKNGTLLYVSEEAARLMNIAPGKAAGQSYFALLFNMSEKGASIQRYVTLLDSEESTESSIELKLLGCPDRSWRGTLMPVDLPMGRCLITVIQPALAVAGVV